MTHTSFYDGANRVSYTRDAKGNEVRFTYNSSSLVTVTQYREVDDLSGSNLVSHTTTAYDKSNRRVAFQDQRYNVSTRDTEITWAYDGDGRVTTFTDADGSVTTSLYDLLGRALQTLRKPDSGSAATWIFTANEYDADSRLTLQQISTNPDTNTSWQTTMYRYDERGRRIETQRADKDVWIYRYDALGNLVEWQDPLTTRVTTAYDSRNLPTSRMIQRGTGIVGATQENYGYDGLGRLVSASNFDGSTLISATSWAYNTLSLAEKCIQTITNSAGDVMGTYETGARYDATGFNTATVFSNGREVIHTPDELNRLAESYDITNGVMIANYAYAGSRLTRRIYGNGVVANYSYEAAGCGCGGASSFIENIDHKVGSAELLFNCSRRYGLTGLVTSERRGHEGGMGNVYRYDSTYRLTATYYGVDLYDVTGDDDHATFAIPANTPTTFAMKRAYSLDPMGNRKDGSGTRDSDDSGTTIFDTDYNLSTDNMNLYSSVVFQAGSASYTYDAIEQMTYDGSRDLYCAYDYKGQMIQQDTDSGLATPERVYSYDCQGRKVTEQIFYDNGGGAQTRKESIVLVNGCCGSTKKLGDAKLEEIHYDSNPVETGRVQYVTGKGAASTSSGSGTHPATAASPHCANGQGGIIVHELSKQSSTTVHRWRHEDQLGSLLGTTDIDGYRSNEYGYSDYGAPLRREVLFDGQDARISSLSHSTPSSGYTTITLNGTPLSTDVLNGAELVISRPGNAGDRYITATVYDTTSSTIVVVDAGGASAPVYAALDSVTQGFIVFDFNDASVTGAAAYSTGGKWTSAPSFASGATTLTDSGAAFATVQIGWVIEVDAEFPQYTLTVLGRTSATAITVKGDVSTLCASGSRYRLYPPPGADATTGALKFNVNENGSTYLWASYRFIPPVLGVDVSGTTYGAQAGANKPGLYHCWNRYYDPATGRWTTPDPVSTPFSNLFDYGIGDPVRNRDPKGTWVPVAIAVAVGAALLLTGCGSKSSSGSRGTTSTPSSSGSAPASRPSSAPQTQAVGSMIAAQGTINWWVQGGATHPAGITEVGAVAKFSYTPHTNCSCDTLTFVQMASGWTNGQVDRRNPYFSAIMDSGGRFIDHKEGINDPYYTIMRGKNQYGVDDWIDARPPTATRGIAAGSQHIAAWGFDGPSFSIPYIRNTAASGKSGSGGMDFETCAFCVDSQEVLGCFKWGWNVDYDKSVNSEVYAVSSGLFASGDFQDAVSRSNQNPAMTWKISRPASTPNGGTSAVR